MHDLGHNQYSKPGHDTLAKQHHTLGPLLANNQASCWCKTTGRALRCIRATRVGRAAQLREYHTPGNFKTAPHGVTIDRRNTHTLISR